MDLSFKSILTVLGVFSLFLGVLSGISISILRIIANPFSIESWKEFAIDLAKIVVNSQGEISETVRNFDKAVEAGYGELALIRIAGASIITISLIYFTYKIMRWFVENPKPTDKLMLILLSIGIVWFITVVASIILGKPNFTPYSGFYDLIANREKIINFIISNYK